jgi:hypothetical protein
VWNGSKSMSGKPEMRKLSSIQFGIYPSTTKQEVHLEFASLRLMK